MLGLHCRFFIDIASPEPQRAENYVQIKKSSGRGDGRAQGHRRTRRGIENPGRRQNRNTGIALKNYIRPIIPPQRAKDLNVQPEIGMPAIMDTANLPDMGRMNGNLPWAEKTICSWVLRAAERRQLSPIP